MDPPGSIDGRRHGRLRRGPARPTLRAMATRITPPTPLPPASDPRPKVFLAGSIDQGRAEPWQARVHEALGSVDAWLFDPRRDAWDPTWPQDPAFAPFREQVHWELDALDRADVIAMYFAPASVAPVTLLEMGLYAASGRLVVGCPDAYWRSGNVRLVAERYHVPCVPTLEALVQLVVTRIAGAAP